MKHKLFILFLWMSVLAVVAQNTNKSDVRNNVQTTVIRLDGSTTNTWVKADNDFTPNSNIQVAGNDNVSYYSTGEGIFISILNGPYRIKLVALTGQLIFNGELNQGRFLIQTRKGIYFLKVNNKSYKVICK